jgi:ABC-type dipeptide/oligopeptide/nickel transport system permease component
VTQLATWSVPTIWAGVMLIGLLANKEYLKWFPTSGLHDADALQMSFFPHHAIAGWQRGWFLDTAWHLVLPVVCLSYGGSAFLMKLTRGSLLENLGADYVRTARAKGVEENVILYRHVFRNSLLSLITVAASILPALLGGSVIVESIFSIPGMGRLGVESVQFRDREMVLAVTLIGGFIGLISQILRDILYAMADPRVSYD